MPRNRNQLGQDDYETPPWLFQALNIEFDFTLDPCASDDNHLCALYYTRESDGLAHPWGNEHGAASAAFVNPPYSSLDSWVSAAYQEARTYQMTVVLLLPVRTNSDWFHLIVSDTRVEKRYFRRRIHFLLNKRLPLNPKTGKPSSPRFASMLAIWRGYR